MGDILGSIFGTSSSTQQTTLPDPVQQQANRERLSQILALFQGGGLYQFGGEDISGAYHPTDASYELYDQARAIGRDLRPLDYSNVMSLDDYRRSFDPVAREYGDAVNRLYGATTSGLAGNVADYNAVRANTLAGLDRSRARSYQDAGVGMDLATGTYNVGSTAVNEAYNAAIARGDYDLARSIATNDAYANRALGVNANIFGDNLNLIETAANRGLGTNATNYLTGLGVNEAVANRGLARNATNLRDALALAGSDADRSLAVQEANRARALEYGLDTTRNYINEIATPSLNRSLTLMGLERSGAVPAAIARATAETAMPYLQGIESAFGTNQANTLNNLMGLRGTLSGQASAQDAALLNELLGLQSGLSGQRMNLDAQQLEALLNARATLGGQYAGLQSGVNTALMGEQAQALEGAAQGNRALGGQRLAQQGQLAGNYQNNVNQLAQALMANNVSLEQAGIAAESALGQQLIQAQNALRTQQQAGLTSLAQTYIPQASAFAQSLPQASATLSLIPTQMQAGRAATLTGLQSIADFPRQLREADLLRRQGLFTSAFTGIPWQAGSTTFGANATGNIFDQLGGTIQSGLRGGGNSSPY